MLRKNTTVDVQAKPPLELIYR